MDSTQNYPHTSCAKLGTGDASKTDEFSEMFQEGEGGGGIFNPKKHVADFGPLDRFFGRFPKIHPFWQRHLSFSLTSQSRLSITMLEIISWLNDYFIQHSNWTHIDSYISEYMTNWAMILVQTCNIPILTKIECGGAKFPHGHDLGALDSAFN